MFNCHRQLVDLELRFPRRPASAAPVGRGRAPAVTLWFRNGIVPSHTPRHPPCHSDSRSDVGFSWYKVSSTKNPKAMVEARTIHRPVSENPTFPREIPTSLRGFGMTFSFSGLKYRYHSIIAPGRRGHATRPTFIPGHICKYETREGQDPPLLFFISPRFLNYPLSAINYPLGKSGGLHQRHSLRSPHQCAHWFAMTAYPGSHSRVFR